MGSSSAYLYVGFPSERSSEDLSRFDYDFFQLERAAVEGVSVDKLGEDPKAASGVFHMPMRAAAFTERPLAFLSKPSFTGSEHNMS